jgi:uncharacterized protein YjbI with pentapeptide repeats
MADAEHLRILSGGVDAWNRWRDENVGLRPDLTGAGLSRLSLGGINFRHCNLADAHLNNADLSGANLSRSNLSGTSLVAARLTGANAREANLEGSNLTDADLQHADLAYASLASCHLAGANLQQANLLCADLSKTNLYQANLSLVTFNGGKLHWANLTSANLYKANLRRCDMTGVSLIESNLAQADLRNANLRYARIIESNTDGADLSECRVYGIAVWGATSVGTIESDLIITPADEPTITVDSLEIAQFVYLLLSSAKLRKALDTLTAKVVLILGRFTEDRLNVLEQIRVVLRNCGYLPLIFSFESPTARDLTETISTLAHLARFIIADITDARSIPQELMAIVPNLPSVPIQPILASNQSEYGMFEHFRRYPWVLETAIYDPDDDLGTFLKHKVIAPVEAQAVSPAHRQG